MQNYKPIANCELREGIKVSFLEKIEVFEKNIKKIVVIITSYYTNTFKEKYSVKRIQFKGKNELIVYKAKKNLLQKVYQMIQVCG